MILDNYNILKKYIKYNKRIFTEISNIMFLKNKFKMKKFMY